MHLKLTCVAKIRKKKFNPKIVISMSDEIAVCSIDYIVVHYGRISVSFWQYIGHILLINCPGMTC